jgi:hypothetical protein
MEKSRNMGRFAARLRALSVGRGLWQSTCVMVLLGGAVPVWADAEGPIFTVKRGDYICELPGTALTAAGLHQEAEDFSILAGSIYVAPMGRGSYLATGDEIRMTSGPKQGERFRRVSENFLRKLTAEGRESDIRCIRKVLNNR